MPREMPRADAVRDSVLSGVEFGAVMMVSPSFVVGFLSLSQTHSRPAHPQLDRRGCRGSCARVKNYEARNAGRGGASHTQSAATATSSARLRASVSGPMASPPPPKQPQAMLMPRR